jgi:hypothetical protein
MTVLSHDSPSRSSRFAITVRLGPLDPDQPVVCDLGFFSVTSTTFSFVLLRFAATSVFQPANLPVVVSLITIPDNGHGGLAYEPEFHVSTQDAIVQ